MHIHFNCLHGNSLRLFHISTTFTTHMSDGMFQRHSPLYLQRWLDWQFSYFRSSRFNWHFQHFNHVHFNWHMNCLHLLHVSWHFNCFRLSVFNWQFNYFQCSYFNWHFTDSFTPIIRVSEDTSTTHLFQPPFRLLIDQGKSQHSSAESHNMLTQRQHDLAWLF